MANSSAPVLPRTEELMRRATLLEGRWLNPGETGAIVLNQIRPR